MQGTYSFCLIYPRPRLDRGKRNECLFKLQKGESSQSPTEAEFLTTLASRSNPGGAGREGAAAGEGAGGGLKGGGLTAGVAPKVAKAAAAAGDAGAAGAAGAGAGAGLGGPGSPGGPGAGPLDKIFPKI